LQAAVDGWEQQRADLMRQLEQAQSRAEAQAQAAEKRLGEALAQIETLRRSAHAVRARLEAEVHAANKRAEQAEKTLQRNSAAAEKLRVANVELTTAVEAAQCRLADLETERAALQEEVERLREGTADPERVVRLKAEVAALQWALDAQRVAAEQSHAAAAAEVAALRIGYEEELTAWQDVAAQREAGLVAAQNELASRLEETQAKVDALQHEAAAVAARSESLTTELAAAVLARTEVAAQLVALEEECERERAAFEAAREREQEQRQAIDAVRAQLDAQRAALLERMATVEVHRDAALGRCVELEERLQAAGDTYARECAALEADTQRGAAEQRQAVEAVRAELDAQRAALLERMATVEVHRDAALGRCVELEERLQAAGDTYAQERAALEADTQRRAAEQREAVEAVRAELDTQRTALLERMAALEVHRDAALQRCAEVEQRLAAAATEHQRTQTALQAQGDTERAELLRRLSTLEDELRRRDGRISELSADLERTVQEYTATQLEAAEAKRRREAEWQAAHESWQQEIEAVRLGAGDTQTLLAATQELQEQLAARAAEIEALENRAEAGAGLARQQAEALSAAKQREARLQRQCTELGGRLQELEGQNAAYLQAQNEAATQIETLQGEGEALRVRVDQLSTLAAQLERQCERVRAERVPAEETRRLQAENARLEARIAEMERQRAEAAHNHSAAVAGYMVELNERAEAVHEHERELQRLTEEVDLMRQACEDAMSQLAAGREERDELQRQLAELRAAAASGTPRPPAQIGRTAPAPGRSTAPPVSGEQRRPAKSPAKSAARPGGVSSPLVVIHLEQHKAFREAVSECLRGLPGARYLNAPETDGTSGEGMQVFLINLLNRTPDSLAAIAAAVDVEPQHIIVYCADGAHGFLFGDVDLFAAPLDTDACVARLLAWRGTVRRLLGVSENVEMMGALRAALSRVRCSTSVALDLRQVTDLLAMVEPEVLLIDLALPGGDALRLLGRLRADPKTRELPIGLLLSPALNASEFRQHALSAVRDQTLSPADLAQALRQRINVPLSAETPAIVTARA
jgi:chromosome segregation ATPase